jgi:hypothetical protein
VWIPRRFLGELSSIDEPVLIVGLNKELEFRAGSVWPHQRRIIEMPPSAVIPPRPEAAAAREQPAPVIGIRLEPGTESRVGRLILAALVVVALALCAIVLVNREGDPVARVTYSGSDQAFLDLRYSDDYHSAVQKLGPPTTERWRENSGEIQYRALWYEKRAFYTVFMGSDRNEMRYIGSMDKDWKVVHFVQRPDGRDTLPLLRSLKKF